MATAITLAPQPAGPTSLGQGSQFWKPYEVSDFMQMAHVHGPVFNAEVDNFVHSLLQLIKDHGLENTVAVWRKHRHFDVQKGEQVVSTFDSQNDSLVTHIVKEEQFPTIPATWSLNSNGTWSTIQFWSGPKSEIIQSRVQALMDKPDFLQAYKELLGHMNVTHLLGISIRIDDLFNTQPEQTLVEGTREDFRYQEVRNVPNGAVDEHFQSCIKNGELGDLRITHWPVEAMDPRKVGCKPTGCMTCGMYGSCWSHWPSRQGVPDRDDFTNTYIPRFHDLLRSQ